MKAILYVICGIVLVNIVVATFFMPAPAPLQPVTIVNASTARGQDPWAANEKLIDHARTGARKSVLDALALPTASLCSASGRKQFVDALNYYYGQRATQTRSYARNWGEPGARHIASVWTTPEDNRAERLTRETYARGYFSLDEFKPPIRDLIADIVRGERAGKRLCAA